MKDFANCPICGDPLLNVPFPKSEKKYRSSKSCTKKLNHKISILVEEDNVESISIALTPHRGPNGLQATWIFQPQELYVWSDPPNEKATTIPFFEPDLSNYKKLVEKVKTYLIFS